MPFDHVMCEWHAWRVCVCEHVMTESEAQTIVQKVGHLSSNRAEGVKGTQDEKQVHLILVGHRPCSHHERPQTTTM